MDFPFDSVQTSGNKNLHKKIAVYEKNLDHLTQVSRLPSKKTRSIFFKDL